MRNIWVVGAGIHFDIVIRMPIKCIYPKKSSTKDEIKNCQNILLKERGWGRHLAIGSTCDTPIMIPQSLRNEKADSGGGAVCEWRNSPRSPRRRSVGHRQWEFVDCRTRRAELAEQRGGRVQSRGMIGLCNATHLSSAVVTKSRERDKPLWFSSCPECNLIISISPPHV